MLNTEQTKLNFTFALVVPFDPKEKDLDRKNFVQGWNFIIHTGLAQYMTKKYNPKMDLFVI